MKPNQLASDTSHPSFLALDRAHLGQVLPDVSAHLGGCEACRRYVDSPAASASASGFAAVQQALERPRRSFAAWVWGGGSVSALVCGLLLLVAHRWPRAGQVEDVYVGAKGFRSVWIYVKHGSETQLWDGKQALSVGDRIRLKVDPGSYHRVEVYSLGDSQHASLLFSGALAPGQNLTLPDAWELDGSSAPERLFVVFSDAPVKPDWDDWQQGRVPSGIAVLPFVLPKNGLAVSDAGSLSP